MLGRGEEWKPWCPGGTERNQGAWDVASKEQVAQIDGRVLGLARFCKVMQAAGRTLNFILTQWKASEGFF